MCGIAGVLGPGAARHTQDVRRMVKALHHRGPDGDGIVGFDNAVIGAARLAVVDPLAGAQPLLGPTEQTALVCNGEIYGHHRLRADFSEYPFRTAVDVEVVLALYQRHGINLLPHLPGTFAFALWDDSNQKAFLARDRFGERPLYWAQNSAGLLVFASELKSLLQSGLVTAEIDPEVVSHALRQGYVPPGRCIWRGINSLGPAERLISEPGREPRVDRWWSPPPQGQNVELRAAKEWFRRELERAVVEQLEADVPVGVFLSGGVDSSTVAALAGRHRRGTPAFAFDMPGESEVGFAAQVAERHGLDLRICSIGDLELADALVGVSRVWDEPFGDSSALPTALLADFASDYVTVALTGDGADELLGGYLAWVRTMLEPDDPARLGPSPRVGGSRRRPRRGLLHKWGRRIPARRSSNQNDGGPVGGSRVAQRYAEFRAYFTPDQLRQLGLPAVGVDTVDLSAYTTGSLDDICRFDLDNYLPGDILVKSDRASMAVGLEVRAPFLDVVVAEGCMRLPPELKADSRSDKILLREAFADLLPEDVVERPKQGFGAPMASWLNEPDVVELRDAHLRHRDSAVFDLLDFDAVQAYVDEADQRLWNLLSLALWWEQHRTVRPS